MHNLLQYLCLKNPMDRGAWWALVHRVTKTWTQLKQLSNHTHMHNLSSQTKDQTHAPCMEAWSLNHWAAREVLENFVLKG